MHQKQKGFHLVEILIGLSVLVIAGLLIITFISNNQDKVHQATVAPSGSGPNYDALKKCGDEPMLTHQLFPLDKMDMIAPLGAINPPDHTVPTDHMYFMYKYERPQNEQYDLTAPGNIVVISLSYSGKVATNGQSENNDYAITFAPCKGLSFKLGHVNELKGPLGDLIGKNGEGASCRQDKPAEGEEVLFCMKEVDINMNAGDVMGKIGLSYVAALDVGVYKDGYKDPGFLNPEYTHGVNAVCPLNYFTAKLRQQMENMVRRTGEPKCGTIGQDKAGTLQGTWYSEKDPEKAKTDWNSHLTLAHYSENSDIGVLAVAGKISDPGKYHFTPQGNGTVNREPSQTTNDIIYCYQHDNNSVYNGYSYATGKVLLKLIDNYTMQAEHKNGTCTASESFSNPLTYYR